MLLDHFHSQNLKIAKLIEKNSSKFKLEHLKTNYLSKPGVNLKSHDEWVKFNCSTNSRMLRFLSAIHVNQYLT